MTTAEAAAYTAAKDVFRSVWKDRIEREFCLFANFTRQAQPELCTASYAYSQISWHIGALLSLAQQVAEEDGIEIEDAVHFLIEVAKDEHNRTFRMHLG